ncbi:MAG: Crp/Fnr family transcriptional regulator [Terriglobales bacterium]
MAARPLNITVSAMMREELLRLATCVSVESKGAVLFRRGDAARGLYLICSGRVGVSLEPESLLYPPKIIGPGSVLGLPATVAGSPYSLTAEVMDKAEVAFIPRAAMLNCLATNQPLCFEVMELLSGEISSTRAVLKRVGIPRHPA